MASLLLGHELPERGLVVGDQLAGKVDRDLPDRPAGMSTSASIEYALDRRRREGRDYGAVPVVNKARPRSRACREHRLRGLF
jgi:hypothetical protein